MVIIALVSRVLAVALAALPAPLEHTLALPSLAPPRLILGRKLGRGRLTLRRIRSRGTGRAGARVGEGAGRDRSSRRYVVPLNPHLIAFDVAMRALGIGPWWPGHSLRAGCRRPCRADMVTHIRCRSYCGGGAAQRECPCTCPCLTRQTRRRPSRLLASAHDKAAAASRRPPSRFRPSIASQRHMHPYHNKAQHRRDVCIDSTLKQRRGRLRGPRTWNARRTLPPCHAL